MKVQISKYNDEDSTQEIKVQIDPWDSWSCDYTLSHIIVPLLEQLKANKQGAPYVDDLDVPENLRSTSADPSKAEYELDEFFFKRFDWILSEMIWGFTQIRDCTDSNFYKTCDAGNKYVEFSEYKTDVDFQGLGKHQERVQNAMVLFGKYLQNLWD